MKSHIVVGLDIGTTKIAALIADVGGKEFKIIGVGTCPSVGLKRGMVVNIEHTVESIKKAMQQAELQAGVKAVSVYVGIAGDHVRGLNSHAVVAVGREDHEIAEDDVRRVIDAAKAINMPMDREIIHVIPQEFIVDKQEGIQNPIGLTGTRLEVEAHVVTGAVASAQNLYRCVQRAGYKVKDIVLEPLASSFAVLDADEQELGVVLIDIGGGTTDIAMFFDGSIRNTDMLGLAGNSVTTDVSICLKTPFDRAEEIKKEFGCAKAALIEDHERVKILGSGGRVREESRKYLSQVIEARMIEILNLVKFNIEKGKMKHLMNAGVVLTGGGSMLEGLAELATEIFQLPVRIGQPKGFGGLMDTASSPIYATGIGLIQYGVQKEKAQDGGESDGDMHDDDPEDPSTGGPGETHTDALEKQNMTGEYEGPLYGKIFGKMKKWSDEFF